MRHNFDEEVNRVGSNCEKWDLEGEHGRLIPLSVADTDFKAPKEVVDAVKRKADFGVYAYPKRFPISFHTSISKPCNSPLSFVSEKNACSPVVEILIVFFSSAFFPSSVDLPPHPASRLAAIAIHNPPPNNIFFIIFSLFSLLIFCLKES